MGGLAVSGLGDGLYSRRIVGWAIADHLRAELVIDALEMAVARRRPEPGLDPSLDQGSQYTSLVFTRRCRSVGIDISMGARGDCFDNAVLESFHATLKKDLIHRRSWPTKADARTAVFDYIETFYNRRRRHSLLGMRSPADFENEHSHRPRDRSRRFAARVISQDQIDCNNDDASRLRTPCPPNRGRSTRR